MLRTALRELRYHPGRYLATLIAVAISIGFMAASSVVTSTEKTAMARQQLLPYGDADLVVSIDYPRDPLQDESEATADAVVAAITKVPGVSVAAPVHTSGAAVKGPSGSNTLTVAGMLPEQLRGSTLRYGRWPTAPHEIALGAASAEALGVNVGGELQSVFDGETWTLTGVTDDPKSLSGAVGYVADSYFAATDRLDDSAYGTYSVKLAHAANMAAAKAAITAAIAGVDSDLDVSVATLAEQFTQAASSMTGDVDALKYVLWVFATISIVVGMITIANTFTILLAGRRRQIGLLRAIGADGAQVRRSVLLEAAFIGLAGACLGVGISVVLAVAVGLYTGSIHWGVSLPWLELAVAIGIGMAMTVAAAFLPSMRNTSIAPMEALRPTDSVVVQRRIGAFRKLACSLLVVGGGVMAWFALKLGQLALPVALVAAALITLGVLFAAPLFVPGLLRVIGAVVGRFGVVPRLAVANTLRNPARASATATALMLAVGLVFTLQVGSASLRETVLSKIDTALPIDIAITNKTDSMVTSVPEQAISRLTNLDGVSAVAALSCAQVDATSAERATSVTMCGYDSAVAAAVANGPDSISTDELWLPAREDWFPEGSQVTLVGASGQSITLTAHDSYLTDPERWFVSSQVLEQLGGVVNAAMVLLRVPDHSKVLDVYDGLADVISEYELSLSGGLVEAAQIEQMLRIITYVLTGLLAVAVLIALVGVGNTLTLSVMERTRESALLRALGLQRRDLKLMLAVEALLVVVAGAVVGLVAGMFFGWLGMQAVVETISGVAGFEVVFAVDWGLTLGLLGVLVVAALLASLVPGQRAANATVVEALADLG